ncbi:MAG: MFS transporter [Marinibacterium sp.]
MTETAPPAGMARNIALFPWVKFIQNLLFWQAVWFLYFQDVLSGRDAILLYSLRELATTLLEVPTGVLSDRLGRRRTLVLAALTILAGTLLLTTGEVFAVFALAQILLGAGEALASGTDNALLYQSLAAANREAEIERQQFRAWRFTFTALAVSAIAGGAMALWSPVAPFLASAAAAGGLLMLVLALREPPQQGDDSGAAAWRGQWQTLGTSLQDPVLIWFFCLSVLMYGYGHLPFVFGQPFILQALNGAGLATEAPLVSGAVASAMMVLSLGASHLVPGLRRRLGTAGLLLTAFALQIWLAFMLALSDAALVIALLFLRMVPSALAGPLVLARIQPRLHDTSRATYLSMQSLAGRLIFALALFVAAQGASEASALPYSDIRAILSVFVAVGCVALAALALSARRIAPE